MSPEGKHYAVVVPEDHKKLVVFVLIKAASQIEALYDSCPAGTFVVVFLLVDSLAHPEELLEIELLFMTEEEIRDQDATAAEEAVGGLRLAEQAGMKAALFVLQDDQSTAVMVHSLSLVGIAA